MTTFVDISYLSNPANDCSTAEAEEREIVAELMREEREAREQMQEFFCKLRYIRHRFFATSR